MKRIDESFYLLMTSYLSANHLSYNFLIYNYSSNIFNSVFINFLKKYLDKEYLDDDCFRFFNGGDCFSKEYIDIINEFVKTTNFDCDSMYRFVVIQNIDLVDQIYLNMLLKTIEEPSVKVIFFFTAANGFNILKSLRSRCFLIDFNFLEKSIFKILDVSDEDIFNVTMESEQDIGRSVLDLTCDYYIARLFSILNDEVMDSKKLSRLKLLLQNIDEVYQNTDGNKIEIYSCDEKSLLVDFLAE
jgi:hypothetical protein